MIERADTAEISIEGGVQAAVEGPLALDSLYQRAESMRADLYMLGQDLARVQHDVTHGAGDKGREANEQLVLVAIRAEAIAQAATVNLAELTRAAEAIRAVEARANEAVQAQRTREADMRDLLEANERLVITALNSQELEATALEAHHRQVAFLATVAHELRNPLMPLRLAALMLDRARTDDAAHARLQATISGQVAQMTRLISDLLDGSRVSTGKFRLERTLIDMTAVIAQVIETCKPAMDARGHTFACEMPAGPMMMLGDRVRLVQVFGNLLDNAAKYTPRGGRVSMGVLPGKGAVTVSIADNGIGITAKSLPHVFDMFVRDSHASLHSSGGLGIGLAVVRELVKAHEGAVCAASPGEDLGSEFTVTLPLVVVNPRLPRA